MPDPRFFEPLGPVSLAELCEIAGATLANPPGQALEILGVAPLDRAGEGDIAYFFDRRYDDAVGKTQARACFVSQAHVERLPQGCVALITSEPQVAYVRAANRLHRPRVIPPCDKLVHPTAELEEGVILAPGAVVGPHARIGRGSAIGANAVIGVGVTMGRDCQIGPNVSVGFALIGDRVRLLAGARVGEAGFGVTGGRDGMVDIPQLGRAILQDGVTVGVNSCIDRGAWDDTVIGENTKLDNLVQIAHNCRIGRNCLAAAHSGISGSTVVGDGVRFGGRAGIADHVTIGDGATVLASGGVMRDIPAGETWGGTPAVPSRQWLRQVAALGRLAKDRGRDRRNEQD
ncbi:MAG TPA: UDP-3-O-(3-hydroxymyristoyl)glucosamine N-acyltransferase [Caulobacteraceae bacterium]|jgi:UDP-3-O-[3-hydroxymyristoyl] glucosamine N-acyltransferase